MTQTFATFDKALKEDYQPMVREQLRNSWMLMSQIESNSKDVQGREAVLSLHVSRSSGVGARAAGSALPAAGRQGYTDQRVGIHRNYARIGIDGDIIEGSASDKGAFVRALESELKGAMTDLRNDVSRQQFNDATKTIAQCGTTTASATVVLNSPSVIQLKQLHKGMKIDIGTTADYDLVVADAEILSIDKSAGTITIDSAVTTSTSHYVSRAGSDGNEITGLRQIVSSTGTLFNVDPTVHDVWASVEETGVGAINEAKLEKLLEDINFESDTDPNLMVTTRGVRRAFAATLQSQKRFMDNVNIQGGFSAVTISAGNVEVPLVVDNDCPAGTLFALNTAHLCQHQMGSPWQFMDRDGTVLKYVHGYDRYEAVIFNYHELTTDRRNAHGVMTGITEA